MRMHNHWMVLTLMLFACDLASMQGEVYLNEGFDYPDGVLVKASGGRWQHHSGTKDELAVTEGRVVLTQEQSEDVNASLGAQPVSTNSQSPVFVGFRLQIASLPRGPHGSYFLHFKDAATGFRARVFLTTNEAGTGCCRLGIAAGANTASALYPADVLPLTNYHVVVSYEPATSVTRLWLDARSETDSSALATDTAAPVALASIALRQSLSSGNGMGSLVIDDLVVATMFEEVVPGITNGPSGPELQASPASQTVTEGDSARFEVKASGDIPLYYQWFHDQQPLENETNSVLLLSPAAPSLAGEYYVVVRNRVGSVTSDTAILEVIEREEIKELVISQLRQLIDPITCRPDSSSALYSVQGIVTTPAGMTDGRGDPLFFVQDATAGIAVRAQGSNPDLALQLGDLVRVTGRLIDDNGLLMLELNANLPPQGHERIGVNQILPTPTLLPVDRMDDVDYLEPKEGMRVYLPEVFWEHPEALLPDGGDTSVTNRLGERVQVHIPAHTDLAHQAKATGEINLTGLVGQTDLSDPRTSGFQIWLTRFDDIHVSALLPKIRFTNVVVNQVMPGDLPTNSFNEMVVRPGEQLTLSVWIDADDNREFELRLPTDDLPDRGVWETDEFTGCHLFARFSFSPGTDDLGRQYSARVVANNGERANTLTVSIYVPTEREQALVTTEVLANPSTNSASPQFNPLRRVTPGSNAALNDQFVELVNFSSADLDLSGWSLGDFRQARLVFPPGFTLAAQHACVAYGASTSATAPDLGVTTIAADNSQEGLALSPGGLDAIVIRNANHYLVQRVFWNPGELPETGSMCRYPENHGGFIPHQLTSGRFSSPGRRCNGLFFETDQTIASAVGLLHLRRNANLRLEWQSEPGASYTVWSADRMPGPFTPMASSLVFENSSGYYECPIDTCALGLFYQITSP
jgi:hypothetical protein